MASPRPLSLSKLLDERSLPTGLIRSADTLPAVVDPECGARLHTGVETFDRLLSGGLREGSFAELAGPLSSGITACAQALAACATRNAFAAWVDLADALDPAAAHASGIELERLLWVRAPAPQTALRACERLLLSRAFALVVLDFFAAPEAETRPRARGRPSRSAPPVSAWFRLQRSAARARCSLLLLSPEPLAGAVPALTVLAQPSESYFAGAPLSDSKRLAAEGSQSRRSYSGQSQSGSWLEGVLARFDLMRDRHRPREQKASLSLAAHPEVPPDACRLSSGARPPRRGGAARAP